jgi:ATP-binding cassette subfamily B protein
MWASGAVSDEDKLDRTETVVVLRRSLEFARPYRHSIVVALGFVTAATLCTVAGPIIVRIATDSGLDAGNATVLNVCVAAYLAVVAINYIVGRQQYLAINMAGEGFLRDLRVRVFERMQAQSMAFYDRN